MEELLLVSLLYDRLPREQDLLSESQDSVRQSLYTEELDSPRLSPSSGRSSEPSVIFSFLGSGVLVLGGMKSWLLGRSTMAVGFLM